MASCQIQISFRLLCLRVTRWYSRGRIDLNWTGISILDLIALRLLAIRARAAWTVKRSLARRASLLALIKVLNHEYGDSHYWRPCILTEKVDHWSGSLGNEASYWAYETWKNIRDLTSKSLKNHPQRLWQQTSGLFSMRSQSLQSLFRLRVQQLRLWNRRSWMFLAYWRAFFKFF